MFRSVIVALTAISLLACGGQQPAEGSVETLAMTGKADSAMMKRIDLQPGDEVSFGLRHAGAFIAELEAGGGALDGTPDGTPDGALDGAEAELLFRGEAVEYTSGVGSAPILAVRATASHEAPATFEMLVRNAGATRLQGALRIEAGAPSPSCEDLVGHWGTDPIQYLARCDEVLDGALDASPSMSITEADICLARGVWGMNGKPYFAMFGPVSDFNPRIEASGRRNLHALVFAGRSGESYALERDGDLELVHLKEGEAFVTRHDFSSELRFDRQAETLTVWDRSKERGLWHDWEDDYAARLSCRTF